MVSGDFGFPLPVSTVPAHELFVIHLVAVKLGAVHAGELGLAANGDPAAAAHTGAVHHDGVQGHHGMHAEGLGGLAHKLHHGHGSDGQNLVILDAALQQSLELDGAEALFAVGAVIGHQIQMIGTGPELVLQNDDILVPEADDHIDLRAGLLEGHGSGQGNGAANAAADHADPLFAFLIRGLAQRTHKVPDIVALVQSAQRLGGEAHLLENNADGALFPVVAGNGQRHALALLVNPEDDELPGLCLFGNKGGLDLHQGDGIIQLFLTHDFVHNLIHPFFNLWNHKCRKTGILHTLKAPRPDPCPNRSHCTYYRLSDCVCQTILIIVRHDCMNGLFRKCPCSFLQGTMPASARVSAGGICSFLVGRSVNAPQDDVGIVPYDGDGCLFSVEIDAFYFLLMFS